ncbi:family 10 glycosylhydrolase [Pedobacter aquae]|uniref:Family 10 glycosylhydrolase n=1 Tax=Pedobacter aquae TaxID=2605747 RepID=A0A5C0VI94_9SPHI|nr:family 10 glycosylhydrolase [Pedobacter aquae]QEK52438.1 family 10 glycosylhydrolase [Pedobacter aquae]
MNKILVAALFFFSFISIKVQSQMVSGPKREFRGVWIATVVNIDWPSKAGLSTAQQKDELMNILDQHQKQGLNAVFFQVRPASDALYAKGTEPWSIWLTGTQGKAPEPFYDPLDFAIKECHKRGMELHAWFNPYRATFDSQFDKLHKNHITNLKPDWFITYGGKKLFNPGLPDVRAYITQVIMNVVRNYDVDGIHFDDYFYPYGVKGQTIDDTEAYIAYNNGIKDIADWRRDNVDKLIKMVSDSIRTEKKHVKFGISPFGIWKNKKQDPEGSETNGGDSYYGLFADSRKWAKEGWVDYINPQIYWAFSTMAAPYNKLVDWWSNNAYGRHLYIGQGAYRLSDNKDIGWRNPTQMPSQLIYNRLNNRVQGSVYFSSKSLNTNLKGISDTLKNNYYKYPSLPPVMLWLDSISPNRPENLLAVQTNKSVLLSWNLPSKAKDGDAAYGFTIYRFEDNEPLDIDKASAIKKVFFGAITSWEDQDIIKGKKYTYVVTALDRLKNESEHAIPVTVSIK